MHRIDGSNYQLVAGKRRFKESPPATTITDSWLNSVQEEIAHVIETAGLSVDSPASDGEDQLYTAILAIITNYRVPSAAFTALGLLQMASKTENFETVLGWGEGIVDRYYDNTGYDTVNSVDVYFLTGSRKVVNDGIGGFFTKLYAGDGTDDRSITGVGFEPAFVWIKERDDTAHHYLVDAIRGATNWLETNNTTVETPGLDNIQAFEVDGFQIGGAGDTNGAATNFVAWCFECPTVVSSWTQDGGADPDAEGGLGERTNANIGMSIVHYQGTGVAHSIHHSLGKIPHFIIEKNLTDDNSWGVYHQWVNGGVAPEEYYLNLNNVAAESNSSNLWDNTQPTSTTFSIGIIDGVNKDNSLYIAYLFTEIAGFSKFGTYEGNQPATVNVTGLGFRPEMIIIKSIDIAHNWMLVDDTRGDDKYLSPSLTTEESVFGDKGIVINDDGFDVTGTDVDVNENGQNYIYAAFGAKGLANAMDMISEAMTGSGLITEVEVYALFEPREAMTINVDYKLFVSRVVGAESELTSNANYWTECTLVKAGDVESDIDMIYGSASVASQTAGVAMRYRWVTTAKKCAIYGTYMEWS